MPEDKPVASNNDLIKGYQPLNEGYQPLGGTERGYTPVAQGIQQQNIPPLPTGGSAQSQGTSNDK